METIKIEAGELFYGGAVNDGICMPYKDGFSRDLRVWHSGNQALSALISNKGRFILSREAFSYAFSDGCVKIEGDVIVGREGDTLRSAYHAVRKFFEQDRKIPLTFSHPAEEMFCKPQYNTWIEMEWNCTQSKVLRYAKEIVKNGFPSGVLMIDDRWNRAYGDWEFDRSKFPSPRKMVKELHEMGFKVMLWCCPFVSPDTEIFRALEQKNYLVRIKSGETAVSHWWNGYSGILDLTNPGARDWFYEQAERLVQKYGIDGFKMDAADPEYYSDDMCFYDGSQKSAQARIWAEMGCRFRFNELRAGFNAAWLPIANRLRDKNHSWQDDGLNTLVPDGIAMGLSGYQFLCPDMIGGGMVPDFHREGFVFDTELFIRYCQIAALFPMMQFSRAPWKVLSKSEMQICKKAVCLHERLSEYLAENIKECVETGEPLVRSMEFVYPHQGYGEIMDQFLLGERVLVVPQLEKGKKTRHAFIPEGEWEDPEGTVWRKGEYEIATPIEKIAYFIKRS